MDVKAPILWYDRLCTNVFLAPLKIAQDSFFLFGPRGVGKSSFLSQRYPHELTFDLLDAETYTTLLASPSRLSEFLPDHYKGKVVIDEVQKIPALLNEVHRPYGKQRFRICSHRV